jgi:divalent metal cation (Fe/Co/Zn/Cd) transporter
LYFTFFPAVTAVAVISDQWIEQGWQNFGLAAIAIVVIHLWFRYRHREQVRINSAQAELEEGEEDFPMRLGLRY